MLLSVIKAVHCLLKIQAAASLKWLKSSLAVQSLHNHLPYFRLGSIHKMSSFTRFKYVLSLNLTQEYPVLPDAIFNFIINQTCKVLTHRVNGFNMFWAIIRDFISVKPHSGQGPSHRCVWSRRKDDENHMRKKDNHQVCQEDLSTH